MFRIKRSFKRLLVGLLALAVVPIGGIAFALSIGIPVSFVPGLCGTPSAVSAIFCIQTGGNVAAPWFAINPTTHQVEIAPPTSFLHAASDADLAAWSLPIVPLSIHRDGMYAAGDGGGQDFTYSASACTAVDHGSQETGPNGGCWIAAAGREMNAKAFGAYGDGTHDDGSPIQAAVNAAPVNGRVFLPPSSACYLINTTVKTSKAITVDTSATCLSVPTTTAFEFTSYGGTLKAGIVNGNGSSATSQLVQGDVASQFTLDGVDARGLGKIGTFNGGYFVRAHDIKSRNLVVAGFTLDKSPVDGTNGIDFVLDGSFYDTDASVSQPTIGFMDVLNWSGLVMENYDIIHGGQKADVWIHPPAGRSGDHLFGKGFFDIRSTPAIRVEPAAGATSDRVNVFGAWIATGSDAIEFDGAGFIDDWNIRNSYIYNNACDGIAWNNTNANPSTISISGNKFSGNSAGQNGVCNDVIVNGSSPVKVSVQGNTFNDAAALTAARPSHNIFSPNGNANLSVGPNDWTFSGALSHLGPMNGTSQVQTGGYRLLAQANITSAVGTVDLTSPDMASYTDLVVEYDTLHHSTGADVTIAFSPDGGNSFAQVAVERCGFQSCTQDRQPYLYGARTSTDDYQGTARIAAIPGAYKAVTYGSSQWIGAGDGLSVTGTIELPSPINDIRVGVTAGTMTNGGVIRVYGRP